ncbi:hypothetical protein F8B43_1573 [Methylorubrum populi]|uniref:Uncharacterized protein n=1 Tax=Methylorubrum populi TaxID=223967 RepID=A0A833MYE3_9HYPH|nr:hypothetical protein F8B43_1573 [Methylorubrum populi]
MSLSARATVGAELAAKVTAKVTAKVAAAGILIVVRMVHPFACGASRKRLAINAIPAGATHHPLHCSHARFSQTCGTLRGVVAVQAGLWRRRPTGPAKTWKPDESAGCASGTVIFEAG